MSLTEIWGACSQTPLRSHCYSRVMGYKNLIHGLWGQEHQYVEYRENNKFKILQMKNDLIRHYAITIGIKKKRWIAYRFQVFVPKCLEE